MNRKLMASVVAVLMSVSIISAGYSAWTIVEIEGVDNIPAQFTVHTLETKELQFDAEVLDESGKDHPVELGSDGKTYSYSHATVDGTEDLEFTLQVTLKPEGKAWSEWTKDTSASFKIWLTEFKKMNSAGNAVDTGHQYLTIPRVNADSYVLVSYSGGKWTATKYGTATRWGTPTFVDGVLKLPLSLGWGNEFSNQNPNKYFNSQSAYSSTFKTKAQQLATIQKYSVTVSGAWVE